VTELFLAAGLILAGVAVIGLQNQLTKQRKAVGALGSALNQLIDHTIDIAEEVNKLSAVKEGKN
jgi:hypothetical protein